jgi:hypothetical protein
MSVPELALACRSSHANPTRIGSACAANRDSQPRTVEAGRPAAAQIRRHPQPVAQASSAGQITDTGSTRRPRQNRGSSTCERPQPPAPEQIARRGRIRRTDSAASRTNRGAACPHGASRPPQYGHASSPDTNCISTRAGSGPTLSNGPPPGAFARPFPAACQRMREGPLAFKITPSLASRPHRDATIPTKPRPATRPHHQRPKVLPHSSLRETLNNTTTWRNRCAADRRATVLNVVYLETAFSPVRAWSIWSYAYVAMAAVVIVSPFWANDSYVESPRTSRRWAIAQLNSGSAAVRGLNAKPAMPAAGSYRRAGSTPRWRHRASRHRTAVKTKTKWAAALSSGRRNPTPRAPCSS